jgi:predicted Zn-dependent protease with MMP-like domain
MTLLFDIRNRATRRPATEEDSGAARHESPHIDSDRFEHTVADTLDALPDEFLRTLDHVAVLVSNDGAARGAYGLYEGAGIRGIGEPARIVVFRDTLCRDFGADPDRLGAEIRRTVLHEVAHHLGYREQGVAKLGL